MLICMASTNGLLRSLLLLLVSAMRSVTVLKFKVGTEMNYPGKGY